MIFLFDIDDTLYDLELPFQVAFKDQFQFIPDDIHEIFLDFRKYNNEVYEKALTGEITMDELVIYRAKRAFSEHGIEVNEKEAMKFQLTYQEDRVCIKLDPYIEKILALLKERNITMGIISNGPYRDQLEKLDYLNISRYINYKNVFVSEKVGYFKPQVEIFKYAVENILKNEGSIEINKRIDEKDNTFVNNSSDLNKLNPTLVNNTSNLNNIRISNSSLILKNDNKESINDEYEFNMKNDNFRYFDFDKDNFIISNKIEESDCRKVGNIQCENDIYYIGDSLENDVMGGLNSGLKTIWINRRNYENTYTNIEPTYEVNSYKRLYELITSIIK